MKLSTVIMIGSSLLTVQSFGDVIANYNFNNRITSTCPVEAQRAETILMGEEVAMFISTDKNKGSATAYIPNVKTGESGPELLFRRVSGGEGISYEPFERDGAISSAGTQALASTDGFLAEKDFDVTFLMRFDEMNISLYPDKIFATVFSVSDSSNFVSRLESCHFTPSKGEYALRYVYQESSVNPLPTTKAEDKNKDNLESARLRFGVWYTIKLEYRDSKVTLMIDGNPAGDLRSDGQRISGTAFAFGGGFENKGGSNTHKLVLDELTIHDSRKDGKTGK